MSENDTVTVPKSDYENLIRDSLFLNCLDAAGVDNWNGYGYALEMFAENTGCERSDFDIDDFLSK